jgi:catechol 2,3-dioxygenase-like lactoylglutathione lyase family enzyme
MTTWSKSVGAITLFVADLTRAKAFYQGAFGLPVLFEDASSAVFRFDNTLINLLAEPEAPGLIAPAKVASADAGSRFQLTIFVDDADAVAADLADRGVKPLSGPVDREWGQRTVTFADPDGHVWEVAQEIPRR